MHTSGTADIPGTEAQDAQLVLPAELGIEQVEALHALLSEPVRACGPVTLIASDVTRLHAASLQLLAAFCRDRRDSGAVTQWRDPSPGLRQAVAAVGLNAWLELPAESA